MKKKLILTLVAVALVTSLGTAAYASQGDRNLNFGQMLPFMKQMHPDFSEAQLQNMYNTCHGTSGSEANNIQ